MTFIRAARIVGHALLAAADAAEGRFDAPFEVEEYDEETTDDFDEFAEQAVALANSGNVALPANAVAIPFVGGPQDGMTGTFVPPVLDTLYLPAGDIPVGLQPTLVSTLAEPDETRTERYDLDRDASGRPLRYVFIPGKAVES